MFDTRAVARQSVSSAARNNNKQRKLAKLKILVSVILTLLAAVTTAEARKVSVGVPVLDVTQSALYVARDRGYYQKEGLEVDLILMRGGVANEPPFNTGRPSNHGCE